MSHSPIYVLKRKNTEDERDSFKVDADTLADDLRHISDYVTEYDTADYEDKFFDMVNYLRTVCGDDNVTFNGMLSFKLTRAGIIDYFKALRTNLLQMIQDVQHIPIELFISNGLQGWWMIKETIESDYEGLWKFEDCCPLPLTSFLQNLYASGQEEYELELIQLFNYHC